MKTTYRSTLKGIANGGTVVITVEPDLVSWTE